MLLWSGDITVAVAGIQDAHCFVSMFSGRLSMKTVCAGWTLHFNTCRFIENCVSGRSLVHYSEACTEV